MESKKFILEIQKGETNPLTCPWNAADDGLCNYCVQLEILGIDCNKFNLTTLKITEISD